jgi:hypothetical protein
MKTFSAYVSLSFLRLWLANWAEGERKKEEGQEEKGQEGAQGVVS